MKSLIATGLVLCAGIVGSLAPATSAYALPINHAGQICHALRDSKTANFRYDSVGIQAEAAGEVICPLVVQKDVRGGLTVDVSVSNPNIERTSCQLVSRDFTGASLEGVKGLIEK